MFLTMQGLEYSTQFKKDFRKITRLPISDIILVGHIIGRLQRGKLLDVIASATKQLKVELTSSFPRKRESSETQSRETGDRVLIVGFVGLPW